MIWLVDVSPEFFRCPEEEHHFSHPQCQFQVCRHSVVVSNQTFDAGFQFVFDQVMTRHIVVRRGTLNQQVEQQSLVDLSS